MADETIPSPELLTRLLCTVTETMWDLKLDVAADGGPASAKSPTQAVTLQLTGEPDFAVLVGWNPRDDVALQAALCAALQEGSESCPSSGSFLRDSIGELVNILAGQVKSELALDHHLGLPKHLSRLPETLVATLMRSQASRLALRGVDARLFVGAVATRNLTASA